MVRYTDDDEHAKTLVIVDSRYFAARKYALMIQDRRDVDIIDARGARWTQARAYQTILFVGSVYEGRFGLLDTAEKMVKKGRMADWQNKDSLEYRGGYRFGLLAVGMSDGIENSGSQHEKDGVFLGSLTDEIPVFFAKGCFDPSMLSARDKLTIELWKKLPEEDLPEWKKEMIYALDTNETINETDESYIDPLLSIIDGRF